MIDFYCPFCKERLKATDEFGDLLNCSDVHYSVYLFEPEKDTTGYRTKIKVTETMHLLIEMPENIWEIYVYSSINLHKYYLIPPIDIGTNLEELNSKLEMYLTFL